MYRCVHVRACDENEEMRVFSTMSDAQSVVEAITSCFEEEGVETNAAEAEEIAMRAFGWKMPKKYWKGSRNRDAPDEETVAKSMEFLKHRVGLREASFAKVVRAFPEVIGLSEARLERNMSVLSDVWRMKPAQITKTIVRKPEVLGNVLDCEGDCKGDCTRCWAQF